MPVPIGIAAPHEGGPKDMEREISRLRSEVEGLRKRKPAEEGASASASRLPLYLSGLALLVSIVALFRH